jgi:HAD superfamily hydrolase (TIGR01549 family)
MDGTIFESYLDWRQIKNELNIAGDESILETIYRDDQVDHARLAILENYEKENTRKTIPINGIAHFLRFLSGQRIVAALVTNNSRENSEYLLKKYNLEFDLVVTRESRLWKPSPAPFYFVMNRFTCREDETISIGDSLYDLSASRKAGIMDVFLVYNQQTSVLNSDHITYFKDFIELKDILETRYNFREEKRDLCRHVDIKNSSKIS